ncbi:MAG: primosomal protein N' [Clostridia bacterium]|nr:primosomal protein N' [Clostridia bacterium]
MAEYVKVHILDVPYHADIEYTYSVPAEFFDEAKIGSLVVVPFGTSNRQKTAIVTGVDSECSYADTKAIVSVMNDYLSLDSEMLSLCEFMKAQTLCTIGEAVRCMVPSVMATRVNELLFITDKSIDRLPSEHASIYEYIKENNGITLSRLKERLEGAQASAEWLIKNKYVTRRTEVEERDKGKYENVVSLAISRQDALLLISDDAPKRLRSKKHIEILRLLCEFPSLTDKDIYERTNTSRPQLVALLEKGYIKIDKERVMRDPYSVAKKEKGEDVVLNDEQGSALEELKALYTSNEARAALLYGITGSGKTSVIKKMIDEVVSSGRSVIVLVPEISLTPQTVSVFCGYYGERVAVIHSSLSAGERFDAYRKIKDGEIDVVIGTRSAIFAPLSNLGMIVIDEEQEHTYKSETSPKYLAHDIARFRCAKSRALMLLASATPSLNSYYKAKSGAYSLIKLSKRYGKATLPDVIITDMKRERGNGNMSVFSHKLATLTANALDNDKQAILFLNRRGYHSALSCADCGKVLECPNCSVALTYHSYKKIDEEIDAENAYRVMSHSGLLRCHYCGYQERVPKSCPSCHSEGFEYVGFGTQKLENDLQRLFPDAKALRLDADTTSTKSSYERILGSFLSKEANVMIGTQMVTKGHNFPSVTLVGVMLADMMLYMSDYRASERTFSMLTQVIGRAGRAEDKGVAVIQTNSPNDRTILYASEQDYDSFYQNEIQIRKAYQFPPFCDIAVITLSSPFESEVVRASADIMKRLQTSLTAGNIPAIAYGPFDAPVYKAQGRYRKRMLVKCKLNSAVREIFSKILIDFSKSSGKNRMSIDFNPSTI